MRAVLLLTILLQGAVSTGTLRGGVSTADDRPLFGATIRIEGPQGSLVSRTDAQGQFVFSSLPPGPYRVFAEKEGYVRQELGQSRLSGDGKAVIVSTGGPIPNLIFRLKPAATITGTVRNGDGFPIANILVRALRRSYDGRGDQSLTLFSSVLTDDLGAFRLYWLDAGDYVVDASFLPQLTPAVNGNEDVKRARYAQTYYPGVVDATAASTVHVRNGELVDRIDFRLQRSLPVQINGRVYSILTRENVAAKVTLTAPDAAGSKALHAVSTNANGVFAIPGVNPGSYILSATTLVPDGQTGLLKIEVRDADVRADLTIGPGVGVPIRLSGDAPPSTDLRALKVSLIPRESFMPAPASSRVQPDGRLVVPDVPPGSYVPRVTGLPENAYVRSVLSDAHDVLDQFLQVDYEKVFLLEIQLAFDGGQITGSVTDAAGTPSSGAVVVLVPGKSLRYRADQYRVVECESDGRFLIPGIRPGPYKLFAWASIETNAWLNAEFMEDYEDAGVPVTIEANAKLESALRLIPEKR